MSLVPTVAEYVKDIDGEPRLRGEGSHLYTCAMGSMSGGRACTPRVWTLTAAMLLLIPWPAIQLAWSAAAMARVTLA